MVFIRLKKRSYKSGENFYAYLVGNKWENNTSKQEIKRYIGRYIKLDSNKNSEIKINEVKTIKKKDILLYLLKKQLLSYDFKEKVKHLFIHKAGFSVNLKNNKVLNKKTNKKICLGLNNGFLCSHTLKKLSEFKTPKDKKKTGIKLIKLFLDLGINTNKELFLEIFNKFID